MIQVTQKLSIILEIHRVGALAVHEGPCRGQFLQGQTGGMAREESAISEALRSFRGDRSVGETEE